MAEIAIRMDGEIERALEVLTRDGSSRSAVIRQAVLEACQRRERVEKRREVLRMALGHPDPVDVAAKLAAERADQRS